MADRLSAAEFAFRVFSGQRETRILVLTGPEAIVETLARQIRSELEIQGNVPVVHVRPLTPAELIVAVRDSGGHEVMLVSAVDGWSADDWSHLDLLRSRLSRHEVVVFVMSPAASARLGGNAPNLASWIGGSVWEADLESELLSPSERATRLKALQEEFGRSDAEVIRLAIEGGLPPEPEFVEWLILLKRLDLIGQA